jgi:hypothetical protein
VTYVLRHVDAAGTAHAWTCGDMSAHYVASWHARDSGRPTEVWRDGVLVTTWTAAGPDPAVYRWIDDVDDEPPCVRGLPCACDGDPDYDWVPPDGWGYDEDADCGPQEPPQSPERPRSRGSGCTNPAEAVSEGDGGSMWVQPVIDYAAL